jgi:uncharacterized glyoxalase superfamily protein PhnB
MSDTTSVQTRTSVQTFYPTLRYVDAPAAIAWLVKTFGFEEAANYPLDDGGVAHAELRFHGGLIMLGSARHDAYPVKSPAQLGGLTGGVYVGVPADDIESHYARTKAAGARIRNEIYDTDYGSREYSAFDPEGYLWSFGTYRP